MNAVSSVFLFEEIDPTNQQTNADQPFQSGADIETDWIIGLRNAVISASLKHTVTNLKTEQHQCKQADSQTDQTEDDVFLTRIHFGKQKPT